MTDAGFDIFPPDPRVARWIAAALPLAVARLADSGPADWRHGATWFPGVDALPNAADGSLAGVVLDGPFRSHLPGPFARANHSPAPWHSAQLSVVATGYPGRDPGETDAAHRYRVTRGAAHLDGLLAEGPDKRRFLREPHGFVLGLPLDTCRAAPLLVWPGSHRIMGAALRAAIGARDPGTVDLTDAYVAARRKVFDSIAPCPVHIAPGGAVLLHRHLLHGIDIWRDADAAGATRRMIAYFRPLLPRLNDWLAED